MATFRKPKIGLALGSGGARGLAHIGVLKVLEKNGISIDYLAGTSIGAVVGGFYATGLKPKEIEEIALKTNWRSLFPIILDPSLKKGFIRGEKIQQFIEKYLNGKTFKDCSLPFRAVATDIKTGEIVVLDKGKLSLAIRASLSVPLIFKPVEIGKRVLVDGGLSAPVPAEIVREMGADIVIAVNLDKHYFNETRSPGWYDIANDSLNILRHYLARLNAEKADIIIEIDSRYGSWYRFVENKDKILNKILAGERAMKEKLPKLFSLIENWAKQVNFKN